MLHKGKGNYKMLQSTCEKRNSSMSIDFNEKLSLLNARNSSGYSIDIKTVSGSENLKARAADVESETWIKTDPGGSEKKIFSAPPGVVPYHVKWSRIGKKSGGQRLIFVWPRKNIARGSCLASLVPLVRLMLVGLVYLSAIHIWPGEFLPTSIPVTASLPKLPVKCSIIEPLWEDDD